MLVFEKRCRVCNAVKKNKPLLERIYNSSFFVPHSKDSLHQISKDYGFRYKGLINHTKNHQFIDSQDYQDKMLQKVDEEAEKNAVIKAVKAADAIQSVIDKGQQRLEDEEITVSTDQLIRASEVKMRSEDKAKDRQLQMEASLAHFMSGESTNERIYVASEDVMEGEIVEDKAAE